VYTCIGLLVYRYRLVEKEIRIGNELEKGNKIEGEKKPTAVAGLA
jgi:hypothetical protein